MDYQEWVKGVPSAMKADPVWKVIAYQRALFLSDLCWDDVTALSKDRRTISITDNLFQTVGAISASIVKGHSRSTGRERVHYYRHALGSAYESRDWYYKGRHVLGEAIISKRLRMINEIVRLLDILISQQRGSHVREKTAPYETNT